MAYTGMPRLSDDSDSLITAPTITSGVNDERSSALDDERSASTCSMRGTTILSSAPPSLTETFPEDRGDDGMNNELNASSLSLNPSMVDSSVLVTSETSYADGYWVGLHRASQSQSSMSSASCDISSVATSASATEYLLANIGRSLVLASVSPHENDDDENDSGTCDTQSLSKSSKATSSAKGGKWWDELQTDEDWDNFRAKANAHLNSLVIAEMKGTEINESNANGYSVDEKPTNNGSAQHNNEGFSKIRLWLQGLYEAITATAPGFGPKNESSSYLSTLIKEAADIRHQLDRLPPIPPKLPELPLDELSSESRDALVQYHASLGAWKGEAMPEREELTARYVQCQEKLLAAIIDAEEGFFYGGKDTMLDKGTASCGNDDDRNDFGASNSDGYIEVISKESPQYDEMSEAIMVSKSKCQLTLGAVIVAALTGGLSILLAMQSKRR